MIIYKDENGELHNDNNPALIFRKRHCVFYYKHGKYHRDNGPAAMYCGPDLGVVHIEYYINGERISFKDAKIYYICG